MTKIIVKPGRGRKDFSKVPQLVDNIRANGLIHPIVVEALPDGMFAVVAGERRFRATCLLAATYPGEYLTIDARYRKDLSDVEAKIIELDENIVRQDLDWIEQCTLTEQIHELQVKLHGSPVVGQKASKTGAWTLEDTAKHMNVEGGKGTVSKRISIARKLRERPDLRKRVEHLPMGPAIKQMAKFEEIERTQRLVESGALVLDATLRQGNCLDLIKEIAPDSIDLVLTDGPFGITEIAQNEGRTHGTTQSYMGSLAPADNLSKDEVTILMEALLPELFRVLKPGSHLYLFFCYELFGPLTTALVRSGFEFQGTPLTWYKKQTTSSFLGHHYCPCSEPILFAWKPFTDKKPGEPTNRRLNVPCRTLLEFDPISNKTHPFEKPQDLLKFLISNSTDPAGIVLDTFTGSGSTILAAHDLGRSAIGFELNPEHFFTAQKRLLQAKGAVK